MCSSDLVDDATAEGVVSVIAAGNENQNADNVSPASASTAITVGAISSNWQLWEWNSIQGSNWGSALDILAPGDEIISSYIGSTSATESLTGTSMATPHVVGLALYAISVDGITGYDAIKSHLQEVATANAAVGDLKGSIDLIANNGNSQQ